MERLAAPVLGRGAAAQEVAGLEAVDDPHGRRPVHEQAPGEVGLGGLGELNIRAWLRGW